MSRPLRVSTPTAIPVIEEQRTEAPPSPGSGTSQNVPSWALPVAGFILVGFLLIALLPRQARVEAPKPSDAPDTKIEGKIGELERSPGERIELVNRQLTELSRPTPQPAYKNYTDEIALLTELIRTRRYAVASELALAYASNRDRPASPEVRRTLLALASKAGYLDIRDKAPGADLGETALSNWLDLDARLDAAGGPRSDREDIMAVIADGYAKEAWIWARGAFKKGFDEGLMTTSDRQVVRLYHANLHNLSVAYVARGQTRQAFAHASTNCAISRTYQLGGESCQLLIDQLGRDEGRWPAPDWADPILASVPRR